MNFVPGADWSERGAGTNAPGTALALDAELQIRGSEHFSRIVQPWSCTAVPVHDPATGALIGAIDLTGGTQVASPQTLALVRATAVAVENHLALLRLRPAHRRRTDGGARLTVLGADRPRWQATDDRRPAADQHVDRPARRHPGAAQPPPRRPERRSPGDAARRQGPRRGDDPRRDVAAAPRHRSRIRRRRGPTGCCHRSPATWATSSTRSKPATSTVALTRYTGALLPQSVSPGIARLRTELSASVRGAVLASGNLALLRRWLESARRSRRPGRLAGAARQGRAGFGHASPGPRPPRRPGSRPGLARPTVATSCNRAATVRNLPSVTSDTFTSRRRTEPPRRRHRQEKRHDRVRATGCRGLSDVLPAPVRELHRRGVGRARRRPILRERQPGHRSAVLRDPALR